MKVSRETEIEQELNNECVELTDNLLKDYFPSNMFSKHSIVVGDIKSSELINKILSIGKANLVVTSPPYNAGIKYSDCQDNFSINDYIKFVLNPFVEFVDSVLAEGGRVGINLRDVKVSTGSRFPPLVYFYKELCENRNYKYRGTHIWYKGREESSTAWGSWRSPVNPSLIDLYEYIYIFQKGDFIKKGDKHPIDKEDFIECNLGVWKIRPVKKFYKKKNDLINIANHPCPFPIEVPLRVIKLYAYPGDLVIDPFGGTGSTTLAAISCGCNSISIDISSSYCLTAVERIKQIKSANIELDLLNYE